MAPATPKDPAEASWHFDRRIPVALLGSLAVQTALIIWWAAGVSSFMTTTTIKEAELTKRVEAVEGASDDVDRRLVRFEVLLEGQTEQIRELRAILTEIRDTVGAPTP